MKINNQKGFIVPILVAVIAILLIGGGVYVYTNEKVEAPEVFIDSNLPPQSGQISVATTVPSKASTTDITNDWKMYSNSQYGFQIKYPINYKIENDMSGWPQAITLFGGPSGQSYYLAIEIWNSQSEFNTARGYNVQPQPVFKKVGNQYLSLWNVNQDQVVDQIISTFEFTN